jgi:hypothetical protein
VRLALLGARSPSPWGSASASSCLTDVFPFERLLERMAICFFFSLNTGGLAPPFLTLLSFVAHAVPRPSSFSSIPAPFRPPSLQLSPVADFVEISKLQRTTVKLTKELEAASAVRSAKSKGTGSSSSVSRLLVPAVYGLAVFVFWGTPIARLPSRAFWPITKFLAFPGWEAGTVGIVGWLTLTHAAIPAAVAALADAAGYAPLKEENKGFLGGGMIGQLAGALGLSG